jgi:hypothetical protein
MIICWNNNRFEAQFTDFQNDLDSVKTAGFRTSGPPDWMWFAPAPGIKALDRLRKSQPKSGLEITELALQHYKSITEKFKQKEDLRKQFKQAQKQAKKEQLILEDTYLDLETGITCLIVKPIKSEFVSEYVRPIDPEERCLLCDVPLYPVIDNGTFCAGCEIENKA